MKTLLLSLMTLNIILLCSMQVFTQGVVISEDENAIADPSAILDVQSGDKGFLPPRMTTAEMNAIANPANGLVVYDTDEDKLFLYNGMEWIELSGGGSRWETQGEDIYRIDGNVGIGTISPNYSLHVETDIESSRAIYGLATGSGITSGIYGESSSTSGRGVFGVGERGVWGQSNSTEGFGVYGEATAGSGLTYGVFGHSSSTAGTGLFGFATADSGFTSGVYGESSSTSGRGVFGVGARGVWGQSNNTEGLGVYGEATGSGTTSGVFGHSSSTEGRGVYGEATASSGETYGVYGESSSTSGRGVLGWVTTGSGNTYGVYGISSSTGGRGVFGLATAISGDTYGVYGQNWSTTGRGVVGEAIADSGDTYGVYGQNWSTTGRGVVGVAIADSGTTYGVYGQSWSTSGTGVLGWAQAVTGTTYGVIGESNSTSGTGLIGVATAGSGTTYGVYGAIGSADGFAGYFTGPPGSRNYFQRSVGIGTLDPGAFLLAVDGNAAKSGGGEWSVFSDVRLKHSIERVQPGMLDRVLQLKGYTFEYNDHAIEKRLALPGRQIGLIAQEVREVFPEWVDSDDEGYLFVTVRSLTAIMVESLRELRAEKDSEIAGLKDENLALSTRLSKLEERVDKLLQQQELEYAQKD